MVELWGRIKTMDAYGKPYNKIGVNFKNNVTGHPNGYSYCFEIWTKKDPNAYEIGLEYYYNEDEDTGDVSGTIIFRPRPFENATTTTNPDSIYKIVFNNTSTTRSIDFYADNTTNTNGHWNNVTRTCAFLDQDASYVNLYITSYLKDEINVSPLIVPDGTQDCYLFGAKVKRGSPYYATAKQGLNNVGTYQFTLFGDNWKNAGLFNVNGFIDDVQLGGGNYPLATDINPANLPQNADVTGAISFSHFSGYNPNL